MINSGTKEGKRFLDKINSEFKKTPMGQEIEKAWEQKRKECGIEKPLNTYEECWHDVTKWVAFDSNHSYHSPLIFAMFQENFSKYPIEFQMRLLFNMYTYEIPMNLRKFNAVLRKIYKAESKEFKNSRTERT